MADDSFLFAADGTLKGVPTTVAESVRPAGPPWRVLVVDDDEEVHSVTRYALRKVSFRDRPLELVSAHSAAEAEAVLRARPDMALVLLDVVMETEDAGLRLVRTIRDELKNHAVRIILRTGQPGQAPEERVIVDYDINDYKAKTELTAQKLFTTVIAALRSFADITAIEANRRGLRQIIQAPDLRLEDTSLPGFAAVALAQMEALLEGPIRGLVCTPRGAAAAGAAPAFDVLASSGCPGAPAGQPDGTASLAWGIGPAGPADDPQAWAALVEVLQTGQSRFGPDWAALRVPVTGAPDLLAWVACERRLTPIDRNLLEVMAARMSASAGNILLYGRLRQANAELRAITQTLEARVAERTRELIEANTKLERLASIDSLTGILNRRRFMELATAERDRAARYGRTFSVLLLDLDHFKNVNDSHGHAAGDTAIRQAAELTARALRTTDTLARYGGEELVALLPETDLASAHLVAERVRALIGATPVAHDALAIPLTASLGVAEWAGPEETLAGLLNRADQALYAAKQLGRNRVEMAVRVVAA
ncbi:diguanylate cyclase [Aerophototrophica crusticola]|uniref:diguanylate cyclase n=1 Tax=Aerophototrophica crusticola TaxID=1709002 RepID=A0A858R9X2_9PROT|nr:diguanylate cyclase [Rhodospirillaceae bacterium B3]